MINAKKKIVIYHPKTHRRQLLTDIELKRFQENSFSKEWISQGYEKPEGSASCWYIDEEERKLAARDGRPYRTDFITNEYFKIMSRIDGAFVEGFLGHTESKRFFFPEINTVHAYFRDYQAGKPVYFTFDKVTLFKVMDMFPQNPVKLTLKRIDIPRPIVKDQAFMIMPFRAKNLNAFYQEHIKAFLKNKVGIDVVRADSYLDNDIIIKTIYKQIENSEFIIADTTDNNKNCFYELGYASAIGKEIIAIQRNNPQGSFFDRSHIRYINYNFDEPLKFQTELEGTILSIRSRQ